MNLFGLFGNKETVTMSSQPVTPCEPEKFNPFKIEDDSNNPFLLSHVTDRELIAYVTRNPTLARCVQLIRSEASNVQFEALKSNSGNPVKDIKGVKRAKAIKPEYVYDALINPLLYSSKNEMLQLIFWQQMLKGGCFLKLAFTESSQRLYIEICPYADYIVVKDRENSEKEVGIRHKSKGDESDVIPFILNYTDWAIIDAPNGFAVKYTPSAFDSKTPFIPLIAAVQAAKLQTMQYHRASVTLEKNPILPSIISVIPPAEMASNAIEEMSKSLVARLKGAKDEGKHMLAFGDVNVNSLSQITSDLFKVDLMQQVEKDIAIAMGVPSDLIGVGQGTYENMMQSRLHFLEMTVYAEYAEPLLNTICGALLPTEKFIKIDKTKLQIEDKQNKVEKQ
jgi:phage portal protein BeeE